MQREGGGLEGAPRPRACVPGEVTPAGVGAAALYRFKLDSWVLMRYQFWGGFLESLASLARIGSAAHSRASCLSERQEGALSHHSLLSAPVL